ncbi:MAG: YoaP domain-containing protein [Eubacteriales bacterium]|nr:YoaP domain-containing protein [Eubacteriales bacterium]
MEYIKITKENIDKEHICCAMSGKQSLTKKEWLKERFNEGLVFYRSADRGKCFIEYIPAENAWVPVDADGYIFINCLWIAGSMKGHGYSNDLLDECIRDAKEQGKKGICILSSVKKKKEFLSDPKYLAFKGFTEADEAECGINLMYLPFVENAEPPKFKECAKHPHTDEEGFVIYFTDQCPFTYYWVPRVKEVAREKGIEIRTIHVTDKETARNLPAPVINYALFYNGEFITHAIQSDKKFLEIAKKVNAL